MTKLDPIIAVRDVEASVKWYQSVFGFRKNYGGDNFGVLVSEDNEIILCLHNWGEPEHPSMTMANLTPGNGLILYFRTANVDGIRQNVEKAGFPVEKEIHLNPNSLKMEFSLKDPDGYSITITEFHKYDG